MEIRFFGTSLITDFRVYGNPNSSFQDYIGLVDTGSSNTSIPKTECFRLGLRQKGSFRPLTATSTRRRYPLFPAIVEVCGKQYPTQIEGLPTELYLIGLDILSNHKITIDWKSSPHRSSVE